MKLSKYVKQNKNSVKRASRASLKFANKSKRNTLYKIMGEYQKVCNIFIEMFWLNNFKQYHLKKEITNIPSSWFSSRMRQECAREALSMCDGALEQAKEADIEPVKPVHYAKRMILSSKIITIERGSGIFDLVVTMGSVGDKLKIVFPMKAHRHMNKFINWERAKSVTVFRDFIQFSFSKIMENKPTEGLALGVDVGINKLLATSDGKLYGHGVKDLISKIRRKKFTSKAYYKAKIELKEYINVVVKKMFDEHPNIDCFVFENLKELKKGKKNRNKSFRKILHNWNYRYLLDYCKQQTETRRSCFRSVNPYKTSQECPSCGHVESGNRQKENFKCLSCDYSNDADLVGALNICSRFTTGKYGSGFKAI